MLNRLMFVYFIQKKGFLDNDRDYLSNKLTQVREEEGEDEFYSFYTNFLTVLFHKGLGHPDRTQELEDKLGKVPYLNGGLFDVHKLETKHPDLKIKDDAFERLFEFFDEYNWYLDNRKHATGKDINPDVIGYIFEKYINDRAEMGAYYTQEDITDYISKNSIIPWLFDTMKSHYAEAFGSNGEVWTKLKESGDIYIYEAVKTGIEEAGGKKDGVDSVAQLNIPDNIAKGLDTDAPDLLERREDWNTETPDEYALPTEIWRETLERWQRYFDITKKIETGELTSVNDLITYNLDIKQFEQDLMEETDDPELVKACWKALKKVTVLDPTCGSGAFLFAALNVLEPLYAACIQKMEAFVEERGKNKFKFFSDQLDKVRAPEHPNHEYYIYKSIILNNLYGVDIMHEAVEIAKLRLFLKLMATVEVDYAKGNLGLEPLPDIDFNIRSGNTLVGYAGKEEFEQMASGTLDFDNDKQAVLDQADLVNRTYQRFKEKQLTEEYSSTSYKIAKDEVNERLAELNEKLNRYLAQSYLPTNYDEKAYQKWLLSHQPFHWLAEFYSIIEDQGGFDVIIGNPPYVEYSQIDDYEIKNYATEKCGNLYAFILERSKYLSYNNSKLGMIVPLSGHSTDRMIPLIENFYNKVSKLHVFNLSGDANPSRLFPEVKFRLSIIHCKMRNSDETYYTSEYTRWYSDERKYLFDDIKYYEHHKNFNGSIKKFGENIQESVINKILKKKNYLTNFNGNHTTYYHNAPVNWIKAHGFVPYFHSERDGHKISSQLKPLGYKSKEQAYAASAVLCSSLFFIWWITNSDCYHLNKREVDSYKIDLTDKNFVDKLAPLAKLLNKDMQDKATRSVYNYETSGRVEFDRFYLKKSKDIIDKIDKRLAPHYNLTDEELDYVLNYQIKYRMGDELGDD